MAFDQIEFSTRFRNTNPVYRKAKAPEYPKPMWRRNPDTGDVDHTYANSAAIEEELGTMGWSQQYIKQEFPAALHGPNNQAITVNNERELKTALKNGWQLKPIVEVSEATLRPSFDRPPKAAERYEHAIPGMVDPVK